MNIYSQIHDLCMGSSKGQGDLILRTSDIRKMKRSWPIIIGLIFFSIMDFISISYIFGMIFLWANLIITGDTASLIYTVTMTIMSPMFLFAGVFLTWSIIIILRTGDIEIRTEGVRLSFPPEWIPKKDIIDVFDKPSDLDRYRSEFKNEFGTFIRAFRIGRTKMGINKVKRQLEVGKGVVVIYKDMAQRSRVCFLTANEFKDIWNVRDALQVMMGKKEKIGANEDAPRTALEPYRKIDAFKLVPEVDIGTKNKVIKRIIIVSLISIAISSSVVIAGIFMGEIVFVFGLMLMIFSFVQIMILISFNAFHLAGRYSNHYNIDDNGVRIRPLKFLELIIEYENVLSVEKIPLKLNEEAFLARMGFRYSNHFYYPTRFYHNLFSAKLIQPARSILKGKEGAGPYQYNAFILGDDRKGTLYSLFKERLEDPKKGNH